MLQLALIAGLRYKTTSVPVLTVAGDRRTTLATLSRSSQRPYNLPCPKCGCARVGFWASVEKPGLRNVRFRRCQMTATWMSV